MFERALKGINAGSTINSIFSGITGVGSLLSPLLGFIGGYINTKQTNKQNAELVRETNEANKQLVEMQNDAAARQSALAYERSKPTTQVGNMMSVGMSRAGAINALNGGGSYTPAPVNVAQQEAPQNQTADFSVLSNLGQIAMAQAQLKSQEKMQSLQLQEQKRQFNENLQLERDKFNVSKESAGYDNIVKSLQAEKLVSESAISNLDYILKEFTYQDELDAQKAEILARKSMALLDALRTEKVTNAMSSMTEQELSDLFELQATLNMLQQGLQYDSSQALIKGAKKLLNLLGASKGAGKNIRTH